MGIKNSKPKKKKEEKIDKKVEDKGKRKLKSEHKKEEKTTIDKIKEKTTIDKEEEKTIIDKIKEIIIRPEPVSKAINLPPPRETNNKIFFETFNVEKKFIFDLNKFFSELKKTAFTKPVEFKSYCTFHETPSVVYIHSTKYPEYDLFKIRKSDCKVLARLEKSYSSRIFKHKFKNKPVKNISIRFKVSDREFLYDKDLKKIFDLGNFSYTDKNGNIGKANSSKGYLVSSLSPQDQIAEFKLFTTESKFYATKYSKYYHLVRKKILLNRRFEDHEYIEERYNMEDFLKEYISMLPSVEEENNIFEGASSIWKRRKDGDIEVYNFSYHGNVFKRENKFYTYLILSSVKIISEFINKLPSASDELKTLFSKVNEDNIEVKEFKLKRHLSSDEEKRAVFSLLFINKVLVKDKYEYQLRLVIFKADLDDDPKKIKFDVVKEHLFFQNKKKIRHYFWESKQGILNIVVDGEAGQYDYSKDYRFIYRVKKDFTLEMLCKTNLRRMKVVEEDEEVKVYFTDEISKIEMIKFKDIDNC